MSENKAVAVKEGKALTPAGFNSAEGFELLQRIGNAFSKSDLVPETYRNNIGNCLIGVELAQRIGASPLMVMQNLHVIQGRPSFSSSFVISAINSCGRFSPLRFKVEKRGRKKIQYTYTVKDWKNKDQYGKPKVERKTGEVEIDDVACIAFAKDLADGEILEGPQVSVEMAVHEGWYTKSDSKWKTMTDLMLRYRAAAFFGRLYAPEILMGMRTDDEASDLAETAIDVTPPKQPEADEGSAGLNAEIAKAAATRKRKAAEPKPVVIDAEPVVVSESKPADAVTDKGDDGSESVVNMPPSAHEGTSADAPSDDELWGE